KTAGDHGWSAETSLGYRIRKQRPECAARAAAAALRKLRHSRRRRNMTSTIAKPQPSTPPSASDDPRWARIAARDRTADGQLWYSVATTGVYCRPSCPSRPANPTNVQIHDTLEGAKATGCRPCKRCKPDGPSIEAENAALVEKACRIIEESEEEPSL